MTPRASLRRLWLSIRLFFFGFAIPCMLVPAWSTYESGIFVLEELGRFLFGFEFLLLAVLLMPANRARVHRWLGSLGGKGASREQEAAAVAELVGSRDATKLLAEADDRFRAISFDVLHEEDFASNKGSATGQPPLSERTKRLALGECEAFLSHSWSDDSAAKYAALARWAGAHRAEQGISPSLWLDKACIDQANIAASLACLPIFLSGCRELLIIAGPTYATRLWCLMEIFTFCKFNGSTDAIALHTIGEPSVTNKSLANFNAANAKCYLLRDRHRLLAVVESSFGDCRGFNRVVKAIFAKKGVVGAKQASLGYERSSSCAPAGDVEAPSKMASSLGGSYSNLPTVMRYSEGEGDWTRRPKGPPLPPPEYRQTRMKRRSGAERAGEFDAEAAAPRAAPEMKRGGTAKAKRGSVEAMLWSQGPPQQLRERFGTMNAREMMRRYKEAKRQVRV